jgi:uncharacterized protein (DUF169 family)
MELHQTLSFMTGLGYIRMEEVPGIPRLAEMPGAVIYSPLGDAPLDPDVVIFAGPAAQIMLVQQAAQSAGRASLANGTAMSSGCIANRAYTDLGEGELYAVVRGRDLGAIADKLKEIATANAKLSEYHRSRRQEISTQ